MYDFLATNKLTGQSSPILHKTNYRIKNIRDSHKTCRFWPFWAYRSPSSIQSQL